MNERMMLMREIQKYAFALTEAGLFLDTHPHCGKAMRFYEETRRRKAEAERLYEEKIGPLTVSGVKSGGEWSWVTEPWPWE